MKLTNNIFSLAALAALMLLSVSCDDFLNHEPSKSTDQVIENIEQLDALLGTYSQFVQEYNQMALASDDFGMTTEIGTYYTMLTTLDLDHILWADTNAETARSMWNNEYEKIYYANLVLHYVDEVSGSESLKQALRAESHFLRAYSTFQLALAYTLYYDGSNGSELGLPLKRSISFEEDITRASLADTWAFIESDLHEALKSEVPLETDGKRRTWRGTRVAINGFAARYYLYRGDMDNALKYANAALNEYSTLKDFNTMDYFWYVDEVDVKWGTAEPETVYIKYPEIYATLMDAASYRSFFEWDEMLFARSCYYASNWYIPSQELLDCFGADAPGGDPMNDLRYKYFMCQNYSAGWCNTRYEAFLYPGYVQYDYDIISGPTVAEMLLIKAEAQARNGNWQEAMTTVATLRKNRIEASEYTAPTATSQADAVKYILRERRREMPFTARWYDLKRLNGNGDPSDDITVTRVFYPYTSASILRNDPARTYTLEPGSRHYAMPIPTSELDLAKGVLEQNRY